MPQPSGNASHPIEASARRVVEALGGHWHPAGATCRCPAHDDRHPSLSVRVGERGLLVKCFAGCPTTDVLRALRRLGLLGTTPSPEPPAAPPRPDGAASIAAATRLWGQARPVEGTPAERYLAARGLAPPHAQVRYLARTPLGRGLERRFLPALLVAVRADDGLTAVQRVFLDPLTGAKRDMAAPRRTLGRLRDGAVRLAAPADCLGLAEGYETARAAMQLLGLPVWAALGAERLHRIAVPPSVRRILLLPDRGRAGERAAARAAAAYAALRPAVDTRWPPAGRADWNDVLAAAPGGEGAGRG